MSQGIDTLKVHPYRVSFGGRNLGILAEIPEIRIEHRCRELHLYDGEGGDDEAAEIMDTRATVAVNSCDIATALDLISSFAAGDDVLENTRCQALVLAPPTDCDEKTLCFPRATLLPQLEYSPRADNHRAKLFFRARPDSSGTLFTFE